LGGVINSQVIDDYVIEHGPDAFSPIVRDEKPTCELNLDKNLLPTNKKNRRALWLLRINYCHCQLAFI